MSIAGNIEKIEERISEACLRSGRRREEITLMGVTKFQSIAAVEEAWNAGLRCFGESRVQEAITKYSGFRESHPGSELHLIGSLQRNKAKPAVSLFDCIQSLDREELAGELIKYAADRNNSGGKPLGVLLEYRTGEDSKSGFTCMEDLLKTVELIRGFPLLNICGLMTMAPNTADDLPVRTAFRKLYKIREELENRYPGSGWGCLSMGMSGDFETAIEEGSTLIRIGGAIFGEII